MDHPKPLRNTLAKIICKCARAALPLESSATNEDSQLKKQDVIDYFGGVQNAADALGMTHQAIYAWGDLVPASRQAHVELATKGKVKRDKVKK